MTDEITMTDGITMTDDITSDNVKQGSMEKNESSGQGKCLRKESHNSICLHDFGEPNVERVIEHLDEAENPKTGISRNRSVQQ